MLDNVRAIYKNGVPHLFTKPLDLSEKEIAAIDARAASENDESTHAEKIKAFAD
jgi:predicted DNA-binding antitoxin AbrB/MazE fold protein